MERKRLWPIPFGTEMHIDPALLSALSALVGALMGGTASLVAAIYTQRYQRGRGGDQGAHRDLTEAERGLSETRNGAVIQEPATRSASTVQPGLPGGSG